MWLRNERNSMDNEELERLIDSRISASLTRIRENLSNEDLYGALSEEIWWLWS